MMQVAWILEPMQEEVLAAMQEVRASDVNLGEQQEKDNQYSRIVDLNKLNFWWN